MQSYETGLLGVSQKQRDSLTETLTSKHTRNDIEAVMMSLCCVRHLPRSYMSEFGGSSGRTMLKRNLTPNNFIRSDTTSVGLSVPQLIYVVRPMSHLRQSRASDFDARRGKCEGCVTRCVMARRTVARLVLRIERCSILCDFDARQSRASMTRDRIAGVTSVLLNNN